MTQYTLSIVIELLRTTSDFYTLICRKDEIPRQYSSRLNSFLDRLAAEFVAISPIGLKRDWQFLRWYRKNKHRFDLFYEPSAQYPAGIKGGVYTVHDILYEEFPEKLGRFSFIKRLYLHHVVKRGIKKSDIVVAVSQFTKDEICKYHKIADEKKIRVVYEGYEHLKSVQLDEANVAVQNITRNCVPYFVYIGSSRGHKNLHNLFLAYMKANVSWKLVVIGRMDRLEKRDMLLVEAINKDSTRVVFTGWIDDSQMYAILSKAGAFVFPSKSEGFGIPILESWYFEVPLLCADIPVFNEVAGDACIKFDPFDTGEMASVLKSFSCQQKQEHMALLQRERSRLEIFSWKKTALEIHKLIMLTDTQLGVQRYSVIASFSCAAAYCEAAA